MHIAYIGEMEQKIVQVSFFCFHLFLMQRQIFKDMNINQYIQGY